MVRKFISMVGRIADKTGYYNTRSVAHYRSYGHNGAGTVRVCKYAWRDGNFWYLSNVSLRCEFVRIHFPCTAFFVVLLWTPSVPRSHEQMRRIKEGKKIVFPILIHEIASTKKQNHPRNSPKQKAPNISKIVTGMWTLLAQRRRRNNSRVYLCIRICQMSL